MGQVMSFTENDSSFFKPGLQVFFGALLGMKARRVIVRMFASAVKLLGGKPITFGFVNPVERELLHTLLFLAQRFRA